MTLAVNRFPYYKMEDTTHPDGQPGKLFPRDHSNGVFTVWGFDEDSHLDLPFAGINQANPQSRSEWVYILNDGDPVTRPMLMVRVRNGLLKLNVDGGLDKVGIPWGSSAIFAKEDNASEVVTVAFVHGGTDPGPEGPQPQPGGLKVNRLIGPGNYELKAGMLNVFTAQGQTGDLPIGQHQPGGEYAKRGDVVYITYRPVGQHQNAVSPNRISGLGSDIYTDGGRMNSIDINAGTTMALYFDGEGWHFLLGQAADEGIPNMGARYGYMPIRHIDKGQQVMFAYARSCNTVSRPVANSVAFLPPIFDPRDPGAKGPYIAVPGDEIEIFFSPYLDSGTQPTTPRVTRFAVDTSQNGDAIIMGSKVFRTLEMRTTANLIMRCTGPGIWMVTEAGGVYGKVTTTIPGRPPFVDDETGDPPIPEVPDAPEPPPPDVVEKDPEQIV